MWTGRCDQRRPHAPRCSGLHGLDRRRHPISVYLVALAAITSIATMAAPETAGRPLK
jgi:hypothetical protein